MDNREELYDKMINIIKDADITDLGVLGKRCSDVAVQYAIDVLEDINVGHTLGATVNNMAMKILELQSLLKQPQP